MLVNKDEKREKNKQMVTWAKGTVAVERNWESMLSDTKIALWDS